MNRTQMDNFIAVLRTALGNGKPPLSGPDWDLLAEWARLQSLTALFYTGAIQYQEFQQWDGGKRQKLQQETISQVVSQAARTELFLEVYKQLLEAGLRPVVLKGAVIRQLYGDLSDYRPSCDEDLYVRPEEAIRCRQELERLGFQVTIPQDRRKLDNPEQEVSMDSLDGLLHIELHPHFFEHVREDLRLSDGYYAQAFDQAVPTEVKGFPLWTLDETHHYLYLFFHLAKHFKSAGVGLKQMLDLMAADRAWRDKIDWSHIRRAVSELRCGMLYGDVTALGKQLGFSPKELFPSLRPELLLADSLEGGVYGHSDPTRTYGAIISSAAINGGERISLFRTVFPTYDYMTRMWGLLEQYPWLLPVGYAKRFYKFFVKRRDGAMALPAIQKGQERTRLLRTYGILPGKRR